MKKALHCIGLPIKQPTMCAHKGKKLPSSLRLTQYNCLGIMGCHGKSRSSLNTPPSPPPQPWLKSRASYQRDQASDYINYNKPTAGPFKCTSSTLGQILNGAGHTRLDYRWKKSSGKTTSHHFGCICAKLTNWLRCFKNPWIISLGLFRLLSLKLTPTINYRTRSIHRPYISLMSHHTET